MKKELEKLTQRQRSIFRFILRFLKKNGYPPTVRDIGKGVGLSSSSTVHFHLNSLEEMGFIKRDPSKPRALKILVETNKEETQSEEIKENITESDTSFLPANEGGEENLHSKAEAVEMAVEKVETIEMEDKIIYEEPRQPEKSYNMLEYPLMKGYSETIPFMDESNIEKVVPLPMELTGEKEGFLLKMNGRSMEGIGILDGDLCIFHKTDEISEGEIAAVISNNELTVKRVFGHMGFYRLDPENRRMNPVYVKELTILGKLSGSIRLFSGRKE